MTHFKGDAIIEFIWRSNKMSGIHTPENLVRGLKAYEYASRIKRWTSLSLFGLTHCLYVHMRTSDIEASIEKTSAWQEEYGDFRSWIRNTYSPDQEVTQDDIEERLRDSLIAFAHTNAFGRDTHRVGRIIYNVQKEQAGLPIVIFHQEGAYTSIYPRIGETEYYNWFEEKKQCQQ